MESIKNRSVCNDVLVNRGLLRIAFAFLLCSLMIMTVLPPSGNAEVPSSKVFFTENADEVVFQEWFDNWYKTDENPNDSVDTWCRSKHTFHSGGFAAYCAKSGYNSNYYNATDNQPYDFNLLNMSSEVPHSEYVQRYDTNMDAVMRKYVSGLGAYANITLSFWFYSDTGISDAAQPGTGTVVGYDFLNVVYYTGSNNSLSKHVAWTLSQEQAMAQSWMQASVEIPNNASWIGFEFVSGTEPPTNGDAYDAFAEYGVRTISGSSLGTREGVFLDDISCIGTVPVGSLPLTTSVVPLDDYQTVGPFPVSFTDNAPWVAMDYIKLYYRVNGTGDWLLYTTAGRPDGKFESSPISFDPPGDGRYEFFTQGTDVNNVTEVRRDAADASTIVDTVSPLTAIAIYGNEGGNGYIGAASINLTSEDVTSGIGEIHYRINGGGWTTYGSNIGLFDNGTHVLEYYAEDRAGNVEDVKNTTIAISQGSPGIVFLEPGKIYPDGNVTVHFTVVDSAALGKLEYSLDDGAFVEVPLNSTSVSFAGLGNGPHSVTVKGTDGSGHTVEGAVEFSVGSSGNDALGDIMGNPVLLGGVLVAVIGALGGAVWLIRRRR